MATLSTPPEQDQDIIDDAALDDTVIPEPYNITSYGADYDVEGLVRRLKRNEIYIPPFQREYVWNQNDASRLVESLLLGLPVPGVFLATDPDTGRFLVIDGQQRLKTLQFFYDGYFNPRTHEKSRRIFKLSGVQPEFLGMTYSALPERDRMRLDNSIIHATIVKQESPTDDDTSVFHIFERLNNGGRKLTDQEIRVALYHGDLIDAVKDMNAYAPWREIFGPPSSRLKDQEFILRFLALLYDGDRYFKPMKEFLNRFTARYRNARSETLAEWQNTFTSTIDLISRSIGKPAFRPTGAINAAVFDSVAVAVARRLEGKPISPEVVGAAYETLLGSEVYLDAVSQATSDAANVATRLRLAMEAFHEV
jgi:hypothetical protein